MNRRDFLHRAAALVPLLHPSADLLAAAPPPAPAPAKVHLAELHLRSQRLPEMSHFYREVLRLPVSEAGDAVIVRTGSTTIRFTPADEGTAPLYHFAFNIPENKLQSALDWLSPRASLVPHPDTGQVVVHFPTWNAHSLYFFDPGGHLVELIARHTLPNAAPGPFTERDVLCASEIGLVVDHVPATVDWLRQQLRCEPYHDYVSADFSAVGDAEGLFILARRNRSWLMTDIPATPFPAEITLAHATTDLHLPDSPYRIRA